MGTPDKDTQDSTTQIAPLPPSIHRDSPTGNLQKSPGLTPPPLSEHHVEGNALCRRMVWVGTRQTTVGEQSYLLGVTPCPQYSSRSQLAFPGYLCRCI